MIMEFLRTRRKVTKTSGQRRDRKITNYPSCSMNVPAPPPFDHRAISHRVADLCLAYHEVDVLVVTVKLIAGGQREDERRRRINSDDGGDDAQEEGEISR